jgi:quercetin dioxygenase-like cupin family protein
MNGNIIVANRDGHARALNVIREQITVLAAAESTGVYEVFLHGGAAGVGPPPHRHEWDESFFVIRGELEFWVDGKHVTARAGSFLHVPAGTAHHFRYGRGGAEVLGVTGLNSKASKLFASLDRDIANDPPEIPKVSAILERHGAALAI